MLACKRSYLIIPVSDGHVQAKVHHSALADVLVSLKALCNVPSNRQREVNVEGCPSCQGRALAAAHRGKR